MHQERNAVSVVGRKNPGQGRNLSFITLGIGRLLPYERASDVFSESPCLAFVISYRKPRLGDGTVASMRAAGV